MFFRNFLLLVQKSKIKDRGRSRKAGLHREERGLRLQCHALRSREVHLRNEHVKKYDCCRRV